jgi:hypothetical protein
MVTRPSKRASKASKASSSANSSTSEVERQLAGLEALASELGVAVNYEAMGGLVSGSGGLCRVKGSYRVIIDKRLPPRDRVQVLSEALGRFDLQAFELADEIRPLLLPLTA